MPELPDVEVFTKYFKSTVLQKPISQVVIFDHRVLADTTTEELHIALQGNRFVHAHRHGKYLLAQLYSGDWLVFHFGMTGFIQYFKDIYEDTPHDSLRFDFEDQSYLAYDSTRKLGEVRIVKDVKTWLKEQGLGPDPLDPNMTRERFIELLPTRRGAIKSQLMNQKVLAGLGNIYADEIHFQVRIHPQTKIKNLSSKALFQNENCTFDLDQVERAIFFCRF
ncbi:MAG: DNA-formamidopyrimidine glycosylase family protein [Desulfovermiculus sp.]